MFSVKARKISKRMRLKLLRNRYSFRFLLMILIMIIISFTVYRLLFGDILPTSVLNLSELHKCPACYGVSMCPALYSGRVTLEKTPSLSMVFNQKNVYYGYTNMNRKIVLKKLAHSAELRYFDNNLCFIWGRESNCKPLDILKSVTENDIYAKIVKTVKPPEINAKDLKDLYVKQGMIMCPSPKTIIDIIHPLVQGGLDKKSDLFNYWTMVHVNAEPLVLQILQKTQGWPVPSYGGVCGRLELLAYEGQVLSSLLHEPWKRKLTFAKSILQAALDFTFKHERYRFYLIDWSLDNIVINEFDEAVFVDLEDIIIYDIMTPNKYKFSHEVYSEKRNITNKSFEYSVDNICKHRLSDHNFWAACHLLAESDTPLLYPYPHDVKYTVFDALMKECLYGDKRLHSVKELLSYIDLYLTRTIER